MTHYEYKVVPAPARGQKAKGVKTPQGRFANALECLMNQLAADGWEFQRAETLPNEERAGLTSSTTTYRSVMVFRRPRAGDLSEFSPRKLEAPRLAELPAPPEPDSPEPDKPAPQPADRPKEGPDVSPKDTPQSPLLLAEDSLTGASAERDPEEGDSVTTIPVALRARARNKPDT